MTPSKPLQSLPAIWTLVPAAGIGARMMADRPKPYLHLGQRYLMDVTLERLLSVPGIDHIHLALHPDDPWWTDTESASNPRVIPYVGGAERDDSVRAGLDQIRARAAADDWVMVHDVARPCVTAGDIVKLMAMLSDSPVGGLLVAPMVDTVKVVGSDRTVEQTADRTRLWRALTPQVFRFSVLDRALSQAKVQNLVVTDEASAVEALGLRPLAITGRSDNIKVTVPEDLALAGWFLGVG